MITRAAFGNSCRDLSVDFLGSSPATSSRPQPSRPTRSHPSTFHSRPQARRQPHLTVQAQPPSRAAEQQQILENLKPGQLSMATDALMAHTLPSLFGDALTPKQMGTHGCMRFFLNQQGLKIASYYWPASPDVKPRGVVLAVHGHGLYLLHEFLRGQGPGRPVLYEGSWIEEWNKAGFSVCGIDQQSHGFSESIYGFRCYVDNFDHYVEDVLHFASILQRSDVEGFSQLPLFLCGESLGGCIAVHAIARLGKQFKGAILLSPMLSLEKTASKGINYYLRPIATLLSIVFPTWAIVATDRNTMFPELQKEWDMDPLAWHGRTRVRVASEYLRASKNVLKRMHTFTFPFLCFHSEEDTLTDPQGSKLLHERSKAADKTLVHPKAMWHSLVKEKGNAELLKQTIAWMEKRC